MEPPRDQLLADGHGRGARHRGARDPGRPRVRRPPHRARHPLPRPDQQLDVHAPRPARPAQSQWARPAGGGDLDLGARHRPLPGRSAAGRIGLRRRRDRPDNGAARERLHDHRSRPRLRDTRRDAHLQLRTHHSRDPADQRRRTLHRDEPRQHRPLARRPTARDRVGGRADQPCYRYRPLLRWQAEPAHDALGPECHRRPLGDHGDDRRPHGHRHRLGPRSRDGDRPRPDRRDLARGRRAASRSGRHGSSTQWRTSSPELG